MMLSLPDLSFLTTSDASSATLIAAGFGASAALIASFLGAWMQAKLQWKREDKKLEMQRMSLYASILGELKAVSISINDKIGILTSLKLSSDGSTVKPRTLSRRLMLPQSTVFVSVANQIGILGIDDAAEVARIYAYKSTIEDMLHSLENGISGEGLELSQIEFCLEELHQFSDEIKALIADDHALARVSPKSISYAVGP